MHKARNNNDNDNSSWLNAIPIEEHGLALNKQEFRDSLCLRYNLPLPYLPSTVLVEKCLLSTTLCHVKGRFCSSET